MLLDDDVIFTRQTEQGLRLVNQMWCPWTREEWLELRAQIDAYFATNPDAQIAQERQEIHDRYFGSNRARPAVPDNTPKPRTPRPGYIYLLHGEDTAWYKIGISIQPKERKIAIATQAPFRVVTVAYYDVDDMEGVEAWWHETFAHKRKNGEWFALDEPDIDLFIAQEGRPIV